MPSCSRLIIDLFRPLPPLLQCCDPEEWALPTPFPRALLVDPAIAALALLFYSSLFFKFPSGRRVLDPPPQVGKTAKCPRSSGWTLNVGEERAGKGIKAPFFDPPFLSR